MGGSNVKNTIAESVMQIIAPHPCYGCGKTGNVLCSYCKYDIVFEPFSGCFLCGGVASEGVCDHHEAPFEAVYTVSTRDGALKSTIDGLKFSNNKSAARALAEVLHESLPLFPAGTVIVPIPTVTSHIRTRGYDHMELIATHLSKLRGMPVERILKRRTRTVQHTAPSKSVRELQASQAFKVDETATQQLKGRPILVLDDIITSGSTLMAAARSLAGIGVVTYGAALAYQPLD